MRRPGAGDGRMASDASVKESARKILIVEDESITALDLRAVLGKLGYDIPAIVSNGEEAIARAATMRPDLILMDIHIKGPIDGIATAEQIRRRFDVPVVYLTAYGDEDTLQRARVTEPFGYLLKPFAERELEIAVEAALFRHQLERRLVENERWMAATLGSIADGVIATGRDGRVRLINPAAEKLTGVPASDATGRRLDEVLEDREVEGAGDLAGGTERVLRTADGVEHPIERSTTAIHDGGDDVIGTVTIFRDISERKHAESELASQSRELARSNAELEQFAYVASHDLREPLRMVASYVQLLAKRYRGQLDKDADEFIGFAVDGVTRMQALIDDLLTYSRVGRGGGEHARIDCEKVFDQAVWNLQTSAREQGASITRGPLPRVLGDEIQLVQLFQNLIGNAIKFHGAAAPEIRLGAEARGRFWRFTCDDNGIGIDPKYAERIFVIFQRLHTRAKYPGTGIGLAICKKIVERHGGQIGVEPSPSGGARFWFTLLSG